jgi:hypothetical protein
MRSPTMRLATIRLTVHGLLVILFGLFAQAQNPVADWDAIALNTIVVAAKKGPPVAPVYLAYT